MIGASVCTRQAVESGGNAMEWPGFFYYCLFRQRSVPAWHSILELSRQPASLSRSNQYSRSHEHRAFSQLDCRPAALMRCATAGRHTFAQHPPLTIAPSDASKHELPCNFRFLHQAL